MFRKTFVMMLALGLFGCGSIVDDVTSLANDLVTDLLEERLSEALADSDAAGYVFAATESSVEVTDETSEIFGAKVIVPANSLPAGVTRAVLSLKKTTVTAPTTHSRSGPAANIKLSDAQGKDVKLVTDATVWLPITAPVDGAKPASTVVLGHYVADAWEFIKLSDTKVGKDVKRKLVAGKTSTFSPFAVLDTLPDASPDDDGDGDDQDVSAELVTYAVFQTGSQICSGSVDLSQDGTAIAKALSFGISTTGTSHLQFQGNERVEGNPVDGMDIFSEFQGAALPALPTEAAEVSGDAEFFDLNVYCDGTRVFNYDGENITTLEVTLSAWETTQTTTTTCGNDAVPCKVHRGSVRVEASLAYKDSNDTSFSATTELDMTVNDATWDEEL